MNTAWTKAGLGALRKLEGARHSLYQENRAAGRNSEDKLRQVYEQVRANPDALRAFAASQVGEHRAMEEGERFLYAMRRRFDGDK